MQRTTIILACLVGCLNGLAQLTPFVHYTPKDGLVNSRVRKAFQDSKGRMYFLTYGGLSVFNGARFKNYTTENGLAASLVNDILEVGDDSLLVASNNGFYVNVLVRGKMKTLNMESGCPVINQFYRHSNGKIYLAADNGLFELRKNAFHELDISPLKEKSHNTPNLDALTGFDNWLVFTVTESRFLRGIFLYDISKNKVCDSLRFSGILFSKDHKGRDWVSTGNNLFILDTAALVKGKLSVKNPPGGFEKLKNYSVVRMMFKDDLAWQILRDKENRSIELRSIDEMGFEFKVPLPAEVSSSIIQQIFVDRENTVWLSNDGEGVFKLVHSPLQVMELSNDRSENISVHHAFHDGQSTWFSTSDRIIYRLSGNSLEKFESNLEGLLLFHNNGKKLLGYDNRTVYEGNLQPQVRSITFKPLLTVENDFFGRELLVDRHENIIAIQESGLSVWKQGEQIFLLTNRTKQDISDKIIFDKFGRLWAINRYSGIDVYSLHPENEKQYLKTDLHFPSNMICGSPRSFVIDKTGKVWIGTRDDGLFVYTQKGGQLVKNFQFHSGNGLTDNFVVELACDSANNIIVGTQTGIDRIVPDITDTYLVENLSRSRNHYMFIRDTWTAGNYAYALSLSGQVFQIEPAQKKNISGSPPLFLEELKLNSEVSDPEKNVFHYKENNITFLFAAPSFIDEKQVRYSYMLEGAGNDFWSDTASSHSAINLTNLSAGKYQLRVKAFFPTISYPPSEYFYSFEIMPPWWQTWWLRLGIAVIAITVLVLGLRFYYRRKLEKQKAELEKQQAIEKERTRIATDMHDDLGAGLSRIKFLSETIGIKQQLSQGVEEEISSIRNYSHEMIDKMGEIVWALNEKNDTLSDLLSYTRAYAVEYLTQHGIECKVQIPDQFPQIFLSGEFRRNIYLTVKEALHNIVKHAEASRVTIRISVDHCLDIQISDDGKGFDKTAIRASSNGLVNMESRIKETGGRFKISGNNGTDINIQVPLFN